MTMPRALVVRDERTLNTVNGTRSTPTLAGSICTRSIRAAGVNFSGNFTLGAAAGRDKPVGAAAAAGALDSTVTPGATDCGSGRTVICASRVIGRWCALKIGPTVRGGRTVTIGSTCTIR